MVVLWGGAFLMNEVPLHRGGMLLWPDSTMSVLFQVDGQPWAEIVAGSLPRHTVAYHSFIKSQLVSHDKL